MSTRWAAVFAVILVTSGGCTPRKIPPKDPESVTKRMLQRFEYASSNQPSITVIESADFEFPPNQLWSTILMEKRKKQFQSILSTLCPCSLSSDASPKESPSCRIIWQGGMDPTCIEVFLNGENRGRFRLKARYINGEMYEFENVSGFQNLVHDLLVSSPESLSYPRPNQNSSEKTIERAD